METPRTVANAAHRRLRILQGAGPAMTVGVGGKCNAMKRDKQRCKNPAGFRTDHPGFGACGLHGGASSGHRIAAQRQQIAQMAQELDVDPVTALLSTVHMTAGMVLWVRNQIETLEADRDEDDDDVRLRLKDLAELYSTERNNLAKMSKMAIDAGIAERQVQIAEAQAAVLVAAIRAVLKGLGLTAAQQAKAPGLIRECMLAIPVSATAG